MSYLLIWYRDTEYGMFDAEQLGLPEVWTRTDTVDAITEEHIDEFWTAVGSPLILELDTGNQPDNPYLTRVKERKEKNDFQKVF